MFSTEGGYIAKVPATPSEALKSNLMGLMEKNRGRSFLAYIISVDPNDPKTFGK